MNESALNHQLKNINERNELLIKKKLLPAEQKRFDGLQKSIGEFEDEFIKKDLNKMAKIIKKYERFAKNVATLKRKYLNQPH